MFGERSLLPNGERDAVVTNGPGLSGVSAVCVQQCRELATLKDISLRLKRVKNMLKITSSIKMIAAAR